EIPISSCAELQDINNDLAGDYYLTDDIDCSDLSFMPIGDADTPFTGTFDGNGFTISNVSIDRPAMNYVGLFGYAGTDAAISDVNLTGIEITGNSHVGGLFGQLYYGTVTDVHVEGTIKGNVVLGGLGGYAVSSIISHASSSGSVGMLDDPTGNFSQIFYGGLIGGNIRGNQISEISCSSSDAEVTGNYRVGGLVGHNSGTITSSFATGPVKGFYRVGGLAGENISGTIVDCFATGSVSGFGNITGLPDSHELGGLVGLQYRYGDEPVIMNSYATGSVTGGIRNMKGILGLKLNGSCTGTFWDKTTSGVSSDACGSVGLTTEEMQDQETYVDWDFDETWMMNGYPVLQCYDTVTSLTGRVWMSRNLGASRVALSSTDEDAYGDLYQWGRLTDGHEKRTSGTTTELSSTDVPGHSDFILASIYWRNPHNNNLWQGVNGVNNPCPAGFKLPTEAEFNAEINSWSSKDAAGAFASPLKLVLAGYRESFSGSNVEAGQSGGYWTSDYEPYYADYYIIKALAIESSTTLLGPMYPAYGLSVRCIKAE
ncbi:MAG: hypothetical protein D3913_13590, partial [Candidatus Electrothrix sp. LOE1_4_5]|nr:hypothetical protein [Candidatus Electrothrix gigas]